MNVKIDAHHSTHLRQGELVSFSADTALMIRIDAGLVWLTIAGDETDYWMRAGDSMRLPVARHIVIEADQAPCQLAFVACARKSTQPVAEQHEINALTA